MKVALDVIFEPVVHVRLGFWIAVILGIGVLCLTCVLLFRYFQKKRKKQNEESDHAKI